MALAFSARWIELLYDGHILESNKMFVVEFGSDPGEGATTRTCISGIGQLE